MKVLFLLLLLTCSSYSQDVYTIEISKSITPDLWEYFARTDGIEQLQYTIYTDLKIISFWVTDKFYYDWLILPENIREKLLKNATTDKVKI